MTRNLYQATYDVLMQSDVEKKCAATQQLVQQWQAEALDFQSPSEVLAIREAGRPHMPPLVAPKDVKKRGVGSQMGRIQLMHAIAHIEFNAINLALDAVYRFHHQPEKYYTDWLNVAADEARHFQLVCNYLRAHDCQYGDYPAHNGMWDMAVQTQHDIVARLALVPRVLEARGLDVTPAMIKKLQAVGDQPAAKILSVIYHDEITHVAIGSYWFKYHCSLQGLPTEATFATFVEQFLYGTLRCPFNDEARLQAGFSQHEIKNLKRMCNKLH